MSHKPSQNKGVGSISYRKLHSIALTLILFSEFFFLREIMVLDTKDSFSAVTIILLLLSLAGSIYGIIVFYSIVLKKRASQHFKWLDAAVVGISLGIVSYLSPQQLDFAVYILFILNIMAVAIASDRKQLYIIVALLTVVQIHAHYRDNTLQIGVNWLRVVSFPLLGFAIAATILRLQKKINEQVLHLQTINNFIRSITSSVEEEEVIMLLQEAIQTALIADTYYVALVNKDKLDLVLFHDDGEDFPRIEVPIEGTLAGWVIRNKKVLFLPDLRKDPELEGVGTYIVGKTKTSLSWMGVPMQTDHITGLIALASYTPNAFDNNDLELLENLTKQASLALNNARHHTITEDQSHKDSLTGIYNHGYFIEILTKQILEHTQNNKKLSLIMLDIDYFKDYNDTYGHLAGDQILRLLVQTIQGYIKENDAIGRWGGEEFAILLPNTKGEQAAHVALRIQETMARLTMSVRDEHNISVPTVSQGIAEFPAEANEVFKLIDLADQRLYIAKNRGRNQIEPNSTHWQSKTIPTAP